MAFGYAIGMLPTAQLVGRRVGRDPTREGSRNPGASNVYRTAGAKAGAIVFAGDFLKGALAAGLGWVAGDRVLALVAGLAAVLGHIAPVARGFRGGKGVATAGGVLATLFPVVAIVVLAVWGGIVKLTGKASLGSIVVVVAVPVAVIALGRPLEEIVLVAVIAGMVVVRHASNIARLVRGDERSLRDPA